MAFNDKAIQSALKIANKSSKKYADGGISPPNLTGAPGSGAPPFQGPIQSKVPGRTDRINMHVKPGSYVVPADIVSSLGEGNTNAGHDILGKMFNSGPMGMKTLKGHGKAIHPKPPRAAKPPKMKVPKTKGGFADGGEAPTPAVPIVAAGGEHVISPEELIQKFGDLDHAHATMDEFVNQYRAKAIKDMKNLKPPKK